MKNLALLAVVSTLLAIASGCAPKPAESGSGEPDTTNSGEGGPITAGKWTVLDTRTDLTDRARAKQNVEDALIRYPDVGCLVGLWSYNAPAILSAVKGAGKEGKVKIVGFDEEDDTLQGVADGHIYATVVQQPFEFGYHSVRILAALKRGDGAAIPKGGIYEVPTLTIEQGDVSEFRRKLRDQISSGQNVPDIQLAEGAPHIAFVSNNVSDFWQIARAGVNKATAEFSVITEFHMPSDGTPAEQQRIVEALIAKKVHGMAISPNDAKNQIDLLNQAAAVMSVITQDSDAPESKRLCYVGTNNYNAGRQAGKLIKEALPDGGSIVIFVGRLDAQNARERRQGILDELSGK